MMYHYEKPQQWLCTNGRVYRCNHPLYNACTLFESYGAGVAIVQQRYSTRDKVFWWGPIDPWLNDDIYTTPRFDDWFKTYANEPDKNGLYPTFKVRKVMWLLRMKPLIKEPWEDEDVLAFADLY